MTLDIIRLHEAPMMVGGKKRKPLERESPPFSGSLKFDISEHGKENVVE